MLIVSWHLVNIYLEKNTVCHFFILIVCPSGPTICEILAISLKQNLYIISEILAMCRKKRSLTITLEKVTLNYLIFLILYKYRIFCHLFFFQKLAIFGFVLQSNQKANHSQMCKKMTMFKKILCLKSIHEKILLACLSGPTIQAVSITCPKIISKKFCPKNLFAILAKFSSICEILAMFKKKSKSLKYLKRIRQFEVFGSFMDNS